MKNNHASSKQFAGLLGFCIYSIFIASQLKASSYSWECKKNRSYLIRETEFVDENVKKFPTKFISNFDKKLKTISLTYDLEKGIATINGHAATITVFPKANKRFKEINQDSVVISSYLSESNESLEKIFEKNATTTDLKIKVSDLTETKKNNFFLNVDTDTANFVSTEFNEIELNNYNFQNNKITEDTMEIEEFIEVSRGKCRLLVKEN